ncbi:hypothetical protein HDA32_000921 [Spinactinospora alkalitolerans]|uniref:DUF397 domain-containing protein n=1 Tax=Spinactinospora alkalitolerans TaxID=687207 RepID=A0A852TQI4_9ACTN|nr:DUF397 domain-containing protein [Spinactinospora alkalitolerans]NYE45801.1 hypothetical protein [Spinactinospora alkalitolerans]
MAAFESEGALWRTSSYSGTGGGNCVEVADGAEVVAVRDSKAPEGVMLSFSPAAWRAFVEATTHDEL